ncbi:PAS domain-containing protein [Massilia sp. PAMC28688]|uniref:PAS domain-containing hybrid sensor histidine kinase/response regulator n=1 Tax=Massilia sp. PAMC28688 TaxID=2861283 RepID=UPI001C624A16|nr:PAS domain-containing protein [Massilia sp. PAMC28688]QYF92204.1 PAS domain-containing protein [Massilia sp. PAMC28688]
MPSDHEPPALHAQSLGWQLFESSPDCVKLLSCDGRVVSMNQNGLCAMEIDDVSRLLGAEWKSLWPPESHQKIASALALAAAGGTGHFQAFCPTARGAPRWWDVVVTQVTAPDGHTHHLLAVSRDMTATHQAERELHASEARFRSLVTATSAIVWNRAAAGGLVTEQPSWAAFTGQTAAQYLHEGWLEAVHPNDRAGTLRDWERAWTTGTVFQTRHRLRRADGHYRDMDVKGVPVVGDDGEVTEWIGVHVDVTAEIEASRERERLFKQVQAANQRMNDILRQTPAFICVMRGPEHIVELINERYLQLVGNRNLEGRPFREALPEVAGQGYFEMLDSVYQSGEPFFGFDMPVMLQRKPDMPLEKRFMDLVLAALRDADGRVTGLLAHGVDQTHRKIAEAAQHASHERLLLATEATELGLWSWTPETDAVTWENARPYAIFGVAPGDGPVSAARLLSDFLHPDDAAGFRQAISQAGVVGARFFFQGRIRRPDGVLRWVEFFGRAMAKRDDAPAELAGTVRDITARKEAEIALYDSRERFEKIVSQAATGVVQLDTTGCITFANARFAQMLGYPLSEVIGMNIVSVTAPDAVAATARAMQQLLSDGIGFVIDKHYLRRDGSLLPATSSVNALRDSRGEVQGMVAIVLDTTQSKLAEQELRASEERYRTVFEAMDQGFGIIDILLDDAGQPADYRFVQMNSMFEKHTGLRNATGRTVRELVPDLDPFWIHTYGQVALTGEAVRFESEAKAMQRWFDVYATRIGGPGSTRVALLFSDVTARRQSDERQRRLAADLEEADRRKTVFLATLAHELRNPLAPIRSGLGVLRMAGDNPATLARVREMMERQVGHMVHLIDDLLDIARISGGKLDLKKARTDLRTVLSSAMETSMPAIEAGHHQVAVNLPASALYAEVDHMRIAQVVANLLNNAAKYTPAGGRIALSMAAAGDCAVIEVADTGIGIAPEALDSVFDMFSQVGASLGQSQGGLGIGLSLVRRLVDMHGGSASVASAGAGQGSTFTVRLPLAGAGAGQGGEAVRTHGDAAGAGPRRVLVVDDNVDAAQTLCMLLELGGDSTRMAHGGREAIAVAADFKPALVFLDIGMPGMNGYDTARAMRAMPELADMMLVALTGWGTDSDRSLSEQAGFDRHLTKPVDMDAIERVLAEYDSKTAPG